MTAGRDAIIDAWKYHADLLDRRINQALAVLRDAEAASRRRHGRVPGYIIAAQNHLLGRHDDAADPVLTVYGPPPE